jgi:hypothetical protein
MARTAHCGFGLPQCNIEYVMLRKLGVPRGG